MRREDLHRLRVRRGQGRRSSASTGAARRTRQAAEAAVARDRRRRAEAAGFVHALGPQGARGAPAGRAATRAWGSRACCAAPTSTPRCTSATTAPTSTPSAALRELVAAGRLRRRRVCVGVRSDEAPPELASRGRPARRRPARRARGCSRRCRASAAAMRFVDFLRGDRDAQRRRRRPRSRRHALAAATRAATTSCVLVRGRLVGARGAHRPGSGAAHETSPPIARLLADAQGGDDVPEVPPGRAMLLNRLWPLLSCVARRRRAGLPGARRSRRSRPASRSSGRWPGAARTPPSRRSRSATASVLRRAHVAGAADRSSCARPASAAAPDGQRTPSVRIARRRRRSDRGRGDAVMPPTCSSSRSASTHGLRAADDELRGRAAPRRGRRRDRPARARRAPCGRSC